MRIAKMHLDLALALYNRRERSGRSVEELAEAAGLRPDRVRMIEEGDTANLADVARVCHALGIGLHITADFDVVLEHAPDRKEAAVA